MKHPIWLSAAAAMALAVPATAQQAAAPIAVPGPQAISAADKQTGAQADPDLTAEYGGVYGGSQSQLVRQVGLKVAAQSGIAGVERDFSFKLLNSGVPNAFAIPGGYVYTTRGLLALMNNEAELAFVLGHETGHIAAHHTDRRQKVTQRSVLLGTLGQTLLGAVLGNGAIGQIGGQLGQAGIQRLVVGNVMSHSRQDEFEADDLGVVYARKAGYDATASSDILASLAAQTSLDARLTGQSRTTPGWAMSHPDPAARVSRSLQRARAQTAAGGTRGGDAFLLSLNGMIYGDDPAQGVIEGQVFRFPADRFQFTAPVGYGMNNGAEAVTITPTTGQGGQASFTGGKFDGNLEPLIAKRFAALSGDANARVDVTPQRTTINGLAAATATLGANSGGQAVDATVVAIATTPTTAYTFTVVQPRGAGLGTLAPLVQSFRRMTPAEAAAVRPRVIQVVSVGRGDTVASLSARMAFSDAQQDRFRVLNAIPAGVTTLPAGRKVKLVVWGAAPKP